MQYVQILDNWRSITVDDHMCIIVQWYQNWFWIILIQFYVDITSERILLANSAMKGEFLFHMIVAVAMLTD